MTQRNLASGLALALGIATLVATLSQCGNDSGSGNSSGGNDGSLAGTDRVTALDAAATNGGRARQDPETTLPPPDAIRILISGSMTGHLEPCGCASGQLGGLARRMQHIGEQRTYDLLLEGGDLVGGKSELDKQKLFTAAQILFTMQRPYDAIGVGVHDLSLPIEDWSGFLLGGPAIASDLTCEHAAWPAKPFLEKQIRKHTVRIASLLLTELPTSLTERQTAPIRHTDPVAAWADVFTDTDDAMMRIVMVHGNDVQIRAIIPQLQPRPDLVIGVDPGYIEPDSSPVLVDDVPLVFAGIRGRVLLDARLWRDEGHSRVACETVPLAGSRTIPGGGGDPDVKSVLLMHRMNVAESGVLAQMAEQAPTPNGDTYVGTASCAGCHPTANQAWQASKHAHAWATLQEAEKDAERYGWPVTQYPDCVGCHVVGYGQKSGFRTFDDTPGLADVGCERCHGPGSGHIANAGKKKLGIINNVQPSMLCVQCHDFEQSPEFIYGERWQLIQHGREPK